MYAQTWTGVGNYDELIKSWEGEYYCFVSHSRNVLALLPFLSLAFGGMYDEPPMENDAHPIQIHFGDYSLEEFAFPR